MKLINFLFIAVASAGKCASDGWRDKDGASCDDYGAWVYCHYSDEFMDSMGDGGFTGKDCKECGCVEPAQLGQPEIPGHGVRTRDMGSEPFPCPTTECWTYDESTHTCSMTGQACATLSCGATGFMISFQSALFNLDDEQVPATFGGGLSPRWDGEKWALNVALGQNGMTYNIDIGEDAITFSLPVVMVGNEMKARTDTIQDNIISLGSQSVVTIPFGAAVIFSCGYDLTIDVASQDFSVTGASVVDTFHASGSLADGFKMTLNNGDGATFLLGNDMPVAITWVVTALSTLSFKLKECTVQHGATAIMMVKEGCYASTLDAVPDPTNHGFSYQVFKGVGETNVNQKITCSVKICETDQCLTPTGCPETGDDKFYGYKV